MMRFVLAGLLATVALSMAGSAQAQFGCISCTAVGGRFHAHGPLYSYANYGQPHSGYGYGGYGGCANGHCFGLNRAPMSRGFIGGNGLGLNLFHGNGLFGGNRDCNSCGGPGYALSTFRNVLHRLNPLAGRGCGTGCSQNACGGCGSTAGCSGGCK